jgi:hypothetical protein
MEDAVVHNQPKPTHNQPGPNNNWGRNRPLAELLSATPEIVTITTIQRRVLDHHYHVHMRKAQLHTPELSHRDLFRVVGETRNGDKTICISYSDTHTCREVIELLNCAVINYMRRNMT